MYKLIDLPTPVEAAAYEQALDEAVGTLREAGAVALYQIGGVSAPGISDLDVVAVFDDDVVCAGQPVAALRAAHRYLFVHNLYGAPRRHFAQARRFSFFHHYRLLWGDDLRSEEAEALPEEAALLKRQIALEYLVKMYASMVLLRAYRTIKVRGFLLHAKAIAYDLAFLGVEGGDLHDLTHRFIGWRGAWFEDAPAPQAFTAAFDDFFDALVDFLNEAAGRLPFYLPGEAPYRVAKNLWLRPGDGLGFRREGVRLPPALRVLGKRYFKLANRLNRFDFTVRVAEGAPPAALAERFRLVHAMKRYNRAHLPGFDALTSSL